ncbi:SDR family oxidoreductase [Nocardia sp. NPDC058176]|uniref:SDR family oxidoreductase n=1 Tax=Nocardia sp. NPDC058176 TaxID=3346368 RepID=UPI0036D9144B
MSAGTVVVTGAGRGLGFAIAERLCVEGHRIVVAERDPDTAHAAAEALTGAGHDARAVVTDIGDPTSVRALAERLDGDRVVGLVNNAAIADGVGGQTFFELPDEEFGRITDVNVRGTWSVTKYLWPALSATGGAIVNIASDVAMYGSPRLVHYVSSKAAVIGMTRSMARDAGPYGVRVNAVAPGLVRVEATAGIPDSRYQLYTDGRALPREQTPEDVAGVVRFLLSADAAFVTGQTIVVDGGFVFR